MIPTPEPLPQLTVEQTAELQEEVRELAAERRAVILAHNYQVPEIQDVADYVGDSLGLSRRAAANQAEVIAFCGVHFMAETASILRRRRRPDPRPRRWLLMAASIDATSRGLAGGVPGRGGGHVRQSSTAEVKALTDYRRTSANAVHVRHIYATGARTRRTRSARTCGSGRSSRGSLAGACTCGRRASCSRWYPPVDIEATRAAHPDVDFLIHPSAAASPA